MANPPQGRKKSNTLSAEGSQEFKREKESSIFKTTLPDNTTEPQRRGEVFASSASRHVLDKQPGFGEVKKTMEDHQGNRGLDTLSSDSRKAPLPESQPKQKLDWKRNNENIIYGDEEMTVT